MGIGMGIGMPTAGAVNPPPPPPPAPGFLKSLSTSIRSASSPGHTSGCEWYRWGNFKTNAACRDEEVGKEEEIDSYPNHGIRLIGNVVVFGDLNEVTLHQNLGRGLHAQFVHKLKKKGAIWIYNGLKADLCFYNFIITPYAFIIFWIWLGSINVYKVHSHQRRKL